MCDTVAHRVYCMLRPLQELPGQLRKCSDPEPRVLAQRPAAGIQVLPASVVRRHQSAPESPALRVGKELPHVLNCCRIWIAL